MDGTTVKAQKEERCRECLVMSFGKVMNLMRKRRRSKGHNAVLYVINVTQAAEELAEYHSERSSLQDIVTTSGTAAPSH
jgi:hypothetical protein